MCLVLILTSVPSDDVHAPRCSCTQVNHELASGQEHDLCHHVSTQVSKLTHQAALANLEVEQLRGALARAAGSDLLPPPLPAGAPAAWGEAHVPADACGMPSTSRTSQTCMGCCAVESGPHRCHAPIADGNMCETACERVGGDAAEHVALPPAAEADGPVGTSSSDTQQAESEALRREVSRLESLVEHLQGRADQVCRGCVRNVQHRRTQEKLLWRLLLHCQQSSCLRQPAINVNVDCRLFAYVSVELDSCSHRFARLRMQVDQQQQRIDEQAARVERLQAARLSAEAELLHARDEVDSLHAALRCAVGVPFRTYLAIIMAYTAYSYAFRVVLEMCISSDEDKAEAWSCAKRQHIHWRLSNLRQPPAQVGRDRESRRGRGERQLGAAGGAGAAVSDCHRTVGLKSSFDP